MTKQEKLENLRKLIESNDVCRELKAQATQLVFGSGSADARVVFIGEAPGKNEDATGEPFVGAAGKFLNEMLASVGLERQDIYITNIVKYRPPDNRDPLPEEKAEFWPYLLKQLSIIQPDIIVTLGRHSGQAFVQDLRISVDHGKAKRMSVTFTDKTVGGKRDDGVQGDDEEQSKAYEDTAKQAPESSTKQSASNLNSASSSAGGQVQMTFVILPLYHPAAALYNGALRQTLLEDFQIVPTLLNEIEKGE
jgi:uracil-DNA glycosylase family 4